MSEHDYFVGDIHLPGASKPAPEGLNLLRVSEDGPKTAPDVPKVGEGSATVPDLRQQVSNRFSVQIRESKGEYEYYYKSDGAEHTVGWSAATTDGLQQAQKKMEKIAALKMRALEEKYKVHFAGAGEDVSREWLKDADCKYKRGEMVHAVTPGLPQLHAIEIALAHSQPSQLGMDGKDGIKIYFLDKRPMPPVTEGKYALGEFVQADKDKHPALFITPDGARLAPTDKDVTKDGERNLAWCIEHELTHNSQENMLLLGNIPMSMAKTMGWQQKNFGNDDNQDMHWVLAAKNGHEYAQSRFTCDVSPEWMRVDEKGHQLTANGTPATGLNDVEKFPGDELRHQLPVEPPTYYFTNPKEMMSEALTSYRNSEQTRARLLSISPKLYDVVQKYDQQELDKYFGVNADGRSNYLRAPDGRAVPRSAEVERSIHDLELGNSNPWLNNIGIPF